ncbi:MAG: cupin domain-containing protein [Asgard group archaeon]|nr:cupin domain-containing protein [Asgard group archaeon]
MGNANYKLYNSNEKQGWFVSNNHSDLFYSKYLAVRKGNFVEPWKDNQIHYHTVSQEIFLVLEGEITLLVSEKLFKLKKRNFLMLNPNVPHAILGGKGKIQNYIMKIPQIDDERIVIQEGIQSDEILRNTQYVEITAKEGFFADLTKPENHNCWLIGFGKAKHHSLGFSLAYMDFKSEFDFKEVKHPNDLHYHSSSEEWYFTFNGSQKLMVGEKKIEVPKDFLLKLEMNTPHKVIKRKYPFEGITLRTPNIKGDKVSLEG